MATKKKKPNSKFHRYFKVILLITSITFAISILIFGISMSGIFNVTGETVVLSNDMFTLKGFPTDYQKEVFKELTAEIEKDEPDDRIIAGLIGKNFVADYYTWSNKSGAYDIGGRGFIYYKENLNFTASSRRYYQYEMTKYLENGIELSQLQEVDYINVKFADHGNGYTYYGEYFDSYYVVCEWTYAENEFIDTSVFPTRIDMTIIRDEEGQYAIAQFY